MRELTHIEQYVIEQVKLKRISKNISQDKLSIMMGLNEKFVSKVETTNRAEKYNINHLNKIAEILQCSIKDFFPEQPLPGELNAHK
ncbi:Cro/C1-type helix-turn-helix DNA-binding protein [Mucilaginibacter yixingensis]|uniref:Cro/C1-type helix-turn-helix DNA-binding protein n=1 Tax=Mucilaginibacter yixingensis TaxID=1295612 RepID=A0A2T5J4J7_9SPHI|nr:Cro/C1-type helix-turn-helix DNA-binding protein [Mucilaginibacter yixingensis]